MTAGGAKYQCHLQTEADCLDWGRRAALESERAQQAPKSVSTQREVGPARAAAAQCKANWDTWNRQSDDAFYRAAAFGDYRDYNYLDNAAFQKLTDECGPMSDDDLRAMGQRRQIINAQVQAARSAAPQVQQPQVQQRTSGVDCAGILRKLTNPAGFYGAPGGVSGYGEVQQLSAIYNANCL
ncbi:MAG: hypothetical protein AAB403_13075 [Planctomycetota bacterium]